MASTTKRIGGKWYMYLGSHFTKDAANRDAAQQRNAGNTVLIIPKGKASDLHYEVWIHNFMIRKQKKQYA